VGYQIQELREALIEVRFPDGRIVYIHFSKDEGKWRVQGDPEATPFSYKGHAIERALMVGRNSERD